MAIFEVYSEQAILNDNGYTHEQLGQHTHEELGEYTHTELKGAELPKLRHLAGWDENGIDLKNLKLQYTQSNTMPGSICVFIREGKECFYTFNNEYEWVRGSGGEGVTPGIIYTAGKNIGIENNTISLNIPVVSESDEDSIANGTYFSEIKTSTNSSSSAGIDLREIFQWNKLTTFTSINTIGVNIGSIIDDHYYEYLIRWIDSNGNQVHSEIVPYDEITSTKVDLLPYYNTTQLSVITLRKSSSDIVAKCPLYNSSTVDIYGR